MDGPLLSVYVLEKEARLQMDHLVGTQLECLRLLSLIIIHSLESRINVVLRLIIFESVLY